MIAVSALAVVTACDDPDAEPTADAIVVDAHRSTTVPVMSSTVPDPSPTSSGPVDETLADETGGDPPAADRGGEVFVDPQGEYTMQIDPAWNAQHGLLGDDVELWAVGPARDGFTPNVNVIGQAAPGFDLAGYLDVSLDEADQIGDFDVIEAEIVTGADGGELGLLRFTGVPFGSELEGPVDFLATFDVRAGVAVVATLTAEPTGFPELRRRVEPFLRTLRRS